MKIIANAFLVALAAAPMASAHSLSLKKNPDQVWDLDLKVGFDSDNDITDTPESLAIFEQCMIMSCNEAHGHEYEMYSSTIEAAEHHHKVKRAEILGLRGGDDDLDDAYWKSLGNDYSIRGGGGCSSCYRTREALEVLTVGKEKNHKDDETAHHLWEGALCDCLGQTDIFAGASDCKIAFV